jgi:hypothetical protein
MQEKSYKNFLNASITRKLPKSRLKLTYRSPLICVMECANELDFAQVGPFNQWGRCEVTGMDMQPALRL